MTIEQALNHPWMMKHVGNTTDNDDDVVLVEEDRQDKSSVEVVCKGSSKRESIRDKLMIPLLGFS